MVTRVMKNLIAGWQVKYGDWWVTYKTYLTCIIHKTPGISMDDGCSPPPALTCARWPGTFRPLRLDALGTCSCSVIHGEVSCRVLVTRPRHLVVVGAGSWEPVSLVSNSRGKGLPSLASPCSKGWNQHATHIINRTPATFNTTCPWHSGATDEYDSHSHTTGLGQECNIPPKKTNLWKNISF